MEKNVNFFRTVLKAFNPVRYDELSERVPKDVIKYFFSFLFLAFILLVLISLPWIIQAPSYLSTQLDKFDKLEISVDTEMNAPVMLTDSDQRLLIDTRTAQYNFSRETDADFIISDKFLYWKNPFNPFAKKYHPTLLGDYKDLLDNTGWYSNLFVLLFILMIPSILLLAYLYFVVKYLLLILLSASIGWLIAKMLKFSVSFGRLLKVGIYAITPAVILELAGFMLNFDQYQLHYALFALFFLLGAIKSGNLDEIKEKESRPKFSVKKKKGHRKKGPDYIDLGRGD